jgi:hypothetical protein
MKKLFISTSMFLICIFSNCVYAAPQSLPTDWMKTDYSSVFFNELRAAIDIKRQGAGLKPGLWRVQIVPTTLVDTQQINELRENITEVYIKCGQSIPKWTDPLLDPSTSRMVIKGQPVYLIEIRKAVENAPACAN